MEFGRVLDPSGIVHQLPPDHPMTARVLARQTPLLPQEYAPNIFIGCPVWTHKAWRGRIFPYKAAEKDFLRYYAQQFNTIELNVTHYQIPTHEQVLRWLASTPPNFLFCPKVPQSISHYKQLNNVRELNTAFCDAILGFQERLGLTFLQLSDRFAPNRMNLLKKYILDFDAPIPWSLELRHTQWYQQNMEIEAFFEFIVQNRVGTIITDTSGRRDVLSMRLTSPTAAIRFLANNRHLSDFQRLEDWAFRIQAWFSQGLQRLYFWLHDYENTHAPDLADFFIQKLNALLQTNLKRPSFYDSSDAQLF